MEIKAEELRRRFYESLPEDLRESLTEKEVWEFVNAPYVVAHRKVEECKVAEFKIIGLGTLYPTIGRFRAMMHRYKKQHEAGVLSEEALQGYEEVERILQEEYDHKVNRSFWWKMKQLNGEVPMGTVFSSETYEKKTYPRVNREERNESESDDQERVGVPHGES